MGYIGLRLLVILWDTLSKTVGYIGQILWDILWNILGKKLDLFGKSYGIYRSIGYIKQKL